MAVTSRRYRRLFSLAAGAAVVLGLGAPLVAGPATSGTALAAPGHQTPKAERRTNSAVRPSLSAEPFLLAIGAELLHRPVGEGRVDHLREVDRLLLLARA